MTQEEKARAYDEALEKIKYVMEHGVSPTLNKEDLQDLFPELAEPEDELIRKEIIAFLKENLETGSAEETWSFSGLERWISWLEKQGEHKDYYTKQELIDMGFSFTLNGDIVTPDKMMEDMKKYLTWLEKQECCEHIKKDWLEHIKQSWYKEGFIDGKYSCGTTKEWTINDAATLKELIDFLENGTAKLQHDLTRYAKWLKIQFTPIEKQGKQKPKWTDSDEERFQHTLLATRTSLFYTEEDRAELVDWLKSLKQRMKEQQ